MIPSIMGVAGSWKPNCHSCAKSQEDAQTPQKDLNNESEI